MANIIEENCFLLKADFFPITVFKIASDDLDAIAAQLDATIQKAPKYLTNAPIIIDVNDVNIKGSLDLEKICNMLRNKQIIPIGIRGLDETQESVAQKHGLALMKNGKQPNLAEGEIKPRTITKEILQNTTKVVDKAVRSGSQIYAKNGDLVVLAPVNPGAEIIADGNIHVYGQLNGRALAGAHGNKQAQIFCESLNAEMVAIAGHYLVHDQIKVPKGKQPIIHISLKNDKVIIDRI